MRALVSSRLSSRHSLRWLLVSALSASPAAFALQPLEAFVHSSADHNPDNAEVRAALEQQRGLAEANLGRALPGISARGTYTRNQYEIALGPIPAFGLSEKTYLQRKDQFDGYFTLNVPLIDVASFERIASSNTSAQAAEHQVRSTFLQVEGQVVQSYYQLVANQALATAAERALAVATTNLQLTTTRFETGKAAALDVDRSNAEVERQRQQLTSAQLQIQLSARSLESTSGLTPDTSSTLTFNDDLHSEAELASYEKSLDTLPAVLAARKTREAAEQSATAQKLTLVPSLAASGTEHGTNAASFSGKAWSYIASANLNWALDLTAFGNIRAQEAAASIAKAREMRSQLNARDSIHRAWSTVASAIARSRSARAEQQASTHASRLAQDRYEAGAATQLDLLQAQRDAFSADVSRIQADADLANARLQLRFAVGEDPFASKGNP